MTEHEVKKVLRDNRLDWTEFANWMHGQTMMLGENGEKIYYDWDVERYVDMKTKNKPTYFD